MYKKKYTTCSMYTTRNSKKYIHRLKKFVTKGQSLRFNLYTICTLNKWYPFCRRPFGIGYQIFEQHEWVI